MFESTADHLFADDVQRPLILRYDPTIDPVLWIALSSTRKSTHSPSFVNAERTIKRDLEAMDGVAAVRIREGLSRIPSAVDEVGWLPEANHQPVIRRLALKCQSTGRVDTEGQREYIVRTLNAFKSIEEPVS